MIFSSSTKITYELETGPELDNSKKRSLKVGWQSCVIERGATDMILAADIGGTKSLFALFEIREGNFEIILEKKYPSKNFVSLEEALTVFLEESSGLREKASIESACFSLAGPIHKGFCNLVNLNWTVDLAGIRKMLPAIPRIKFYNDLVALGHGIPILAEEDLFCLTDPISSNLSRDLLNKAVLAPGTGLGESLIMEGKVYPSEGAHVEFGPRTEEEVRLWRFLNRRFGHVSYERILSGPGLKNIYGFLIEDKTNSLPLPAPLDLTPEAISSNALTNSCPLCQHALTLFGSVLGAEAGNLALKSLAMGGIFLGGGIPPKILPALKDGPFLASFRAKGRYSDFMRQIPIYVILNDRTALYGAALLATQA